MSNPKFILPSSLLERVPEDKKLQVLNIASCFTKSILYKPKDEKIIFGLPYPYLVPDYHHFKEFFYWYSFYMLLGIVFYEDTKKLFQGILKNFAYEIKRFGKIPNSNNYFSLSRS